VAISEDTANQPVAVHPTGTTATTASFTPSAGSLLVALVAVDGNTSGATTVTLSDSQTATWTLLKRVNAFSATNILGGSAEVWCRDASGGALTVTASGWAASGGNLTVRTLLGAAATASQTGATGASTTGASVPPTAILTPTTIGSWVYGACLDYTTNATLTANASSTLIDQFVDATNGDTWATFKGSAATSVLSSTTYGFTNVNAQYNVAAAEILPAAGAAASIPRTPVQQQGRDPGKSWWVQRDRRNAHLVATPANPLPAPLDSAWQAGGAYWHLYGDFRRAAWQPQRPSYSDPSLLSAAPAVDVPAGPPRAPVTSDGSPVPFQQPRRTDVSLLAAAQLENELLGGADTARHYPSAATNADRREAPQQRVYYDPGLLGSAQLEDALLLGTEFEKRTFTPATHVPRVWPLQQPRRLADQSGAPPNLLDPTTAGQPVRTVATLAPATHADRREYPQQRTAATAPDDVTVIGTGATGGWWSIDDIASYLGQRRAFDPSLLSTPAVPFDPTLGAWLPLWLAWNRAATHVDRRQYPQQRAYLSDPSFYPTIAPTDPLTLAWGAGGAYWLLYNRAATHTDRRLVPQQRERESEPGLLASALLEDALLGGWDDRLRHYLPAAYTDRREVPQQRPYISDPSVYPPPANPADPLLLAGAVGGDLWRRYLLPAYADRREVPQQPQREWLYFDAGPGVPPLTLAWGAGGAYWHRYNRPSIARPFWPRLILPLPPMDCDCQTHRPFIGVTTRPGSGITGRPSSGITVRPCTCNGGG
jgi:hypothetical protein